MALQVPSLLSTHAGSAYEYALVAPLYRLYRQGPSLRGFGFWRGASSEDICSALTNVEATFWCDHLERCETLIYVDFKSYVIVGETIVYFCVLVALARCVFRLCRGTVTHALRERGWVDRYSPVGWSSWKRRDELAQKVLATLYHKRARPTRANKRTWTNADACNDDNDDDDSTETDSPYEVYCRGASESPKRRRGRRRRRPSV